jgi:putative transposase
MRTELVEDALKNAAATTVIEAGAIFHSDRGSVYTSADFRALVASLGMRSSMGRTGVCWDCQAVHVGSRLGSEVLAVAA